MGNGTKIVDEDFLIEFIELHGPETKSRVVFLKCDLERLGCAHGIVWTYIT